MITLMPIMIFMTRFYPDTEYTRGSKPVHHKIFNIFISVLALFALVVSSCEEDPTVIGKELLPAGDFVDIESIDTISPLSFTMYDDSVNTELPNDSYLGQTWDPYFGTTTASFVSQLRLKDRWDGKAYTVDSMKLMMQFSNVSGVTTGTHYLRISEIANPITTDGKYYSNTQVPLAGFTMDIPLPTLKKDTINDVAIKLPDLSFADRLLSDTSKLFHSNNISDFRSYFKGLHFELVSAGNPAMMAVSLRNNNNSANYLIYDRYYANFFVIYLHDAAGNKKSFYLILDAINRNASFSLYDHDFSTADPDKQIMHFNDPSHQDSLTYLQSLYGVYTRITLPGLKAIKESGVLQSVAVNKARLTVPFYTDDNLYKKSDVPKFLYIRYRTASGTKPLVPDFNVDENHSFYDGLADTTKLVYNFNLATFVQEYLEDTSGNILPELELLQVSGIKNLILKGSNSSTPVSFDLTYTRF